MVGSREQLVLSGVALAEAGDERSLARVLHTESVCRAAGVSRRTFYDQFPSTQDFTEEIARRISAGSRTVEEFDVDGALAAGADLQALLVAMFEWYGADIGVNARLRFWDRTVESNLATSLRRLAESIGDAGYSTASDTPPTAVIAGVEAIAAAGQRRDVSARESAALAAGLIASCFFRHDEPSRRNVDASVMSSELRAAQLHPSGDAVRHLRRLVVDAALAEIERVGPDEANLVDVAHRVGVSAGALALTMGSIVELATIGLEELVFDIAPSVRADLDGGATDDEIVTRHAHQIAALLAERPRLCELVVASGSRGDRSPLKALCSAAGQIVDATSIDEDALERGFLVLATFAGRGDPLPDALLWEIVRPA